jgi:biopolymer transport protein ExbD
MIDVVFLLLVFFMLAARFGQEAEITLTPSGGGSVAEAWQGPPRLIEVAPDGLRLNGVETALSTLSGALVPLMAAPDDAIILIPADGADLQRLLDVMAALRDAGHTTLILAEAP